MAAEALPETPSAVEDMADRLVRRYERLCGEGRRAEAAGQRNTAQHYYAQAEGTALAIELLRGDQLHG